MQCHTILRWPVIAQSMLQHAVMPTTPSKTPRLVGVTLDSFITRQERQGQGTKQGCYLQREPAVMFIIKSTQETDNRTGIILWAVDRALLVP
jgi:hypothetical protein